MRLRKWLKVAGLSLSVGVAMSLAVPQLVQPVKTVQAEEGEVTPITVTMSKASGIYGESFALTLTSEGAKSIYYTLDGSNPVTSGTRKQYAGAITITDRSNDANYLSAVDPILFDSANVNWNKRNQEYTTTQKAPAANQVDKGTVVKAVAVDAQNNYGTVETNTYFVGTVAKHIQGAEQSAAAAGIGLSVMSISVDYDDLFDYEKGIYVKGKLFDEALEGYLAENPNMSVNTMNDVARRLPANYSARGKEWERSAHIDYFEADGQSMQCQLQQDCGIRIQGNYSRSDLMKGLRLYARADYGKKNFKYPFFADAKDDTGETISKYKKLVLRNGGNYAFAGTKYNDTYWQSMLADLKCETQSSRACVVYIDGEYWGLYVLQQDYDDNYFEVTHGVNKDSVLVYKASDAAEDADYGYKLDEGILPDGVTQDYYYKDLLEFFAKHKHLQKDADYEEFIQLVDPQSVMDYFAVNVWINNKWDWPGKNWSMWRTSEKDSSNAYADGRWRFCYYDMDFGGCGGEGEIYANTIRDDNYNTGINGDGEYINDKGLLGQNLKGALNPALQCFVLLMTNEKFREAYKTELRNLENTVFKEADALAKLDKFKDTYGPLFTQFYTRYNWNNDPEYGYYASYNCLKSFVMGRKKGIASNIQFIDSFFANYDYTEPTPPPEGTTPPPEGTTPPPEGTTPPPEGSTTPPPDTNVTASPSPTPGGGDKVNEPPKKTTKPVVKKKVKKLTVTAKKGKKSIQVKTIAKAKVTITLSQKYIVKGRKKVKKITVTADKKGVIRLKLSKKLTKGMKITVTVKKSGYQTKKKTVKVR